MRPALRLSLAIGAPTLAILLAVSVGAWNAVGQEPVDDGRNWLDNEHYTLRLPEGLETAQEYESNGLVWRYAGQEVYMEAPLRTDLHVFWDEGGDPPEDLTDRLLRTYWVDDYGRRWEVAEVDEEVVQARIAAYDERVQEAFGYEPEGEAAGEAASLLDGEGWATYTSHTWLEDQCVAGGDPEIERWDSDNRVLASNPMDARERKAVFIQNTSGGTCSGVMVDDDTVLTAAHCLYNATGSLLGNTAFTVCTHGNYQCPNPLDPAVCAKCITSEGRIVGPDWDWSNQAPEDDYGLIHLESGASVGWMALSTASDGVISAATAYMVGYPGWVGGSSCTQTLITSNAITIDDSFNGRYEYKMSGSITHTPAGRIGTNIDSSNGQSGSPVFYYPDGCCGSHFVTGLNTGHFDGPFNEYTAGPKARDIRDWVIANMD